MAKYGTFTNGSVLTAAEANDFLVPNSVSPILWQTNPMTMTNSVGLWYRVNKLVFYTFTSQVAPGDTPVAGSPIIINLPSSGAVSTTRCVGSAVFIDKGTPDVYRLLRCVKLPANQVAFLSSTATSLTSYLGTTNGPAVTLAVGDVIQGSIVYEGA